MLLRIRDGNYFDCIQRRKDYNFLNNMVQPKKQLEKEWMKSVHLFYSCKDTNNYNEEQLQRPKTQIAIIKAFHNNNSIARWASTKEAERFDLY